MRLLPQDRKFFDMFASMADALVDGAKLLEEILAKPGELNGRLAKLKEIEHRGDEITHTVMVRLHQTFITPLDRKTFTPGLGPRRRARLHLCRR